MEVRTPEGWRRGYKTLASPFDDNTHAPEGLYEGDVAVIYSTADVTPDHLAVIREGEGLWFGKYHPAPGGYFTFERDGEVTRYIPCDSPPRRPQHIGIQHRANLLEVSLAAGAWEGQDTGSGAAV